MGAVPCYLDIEAGQVLARWLDGQAIHMQELEYHSNPSMSRSFGILNAQAGSNLQRNGIGFSDAWCQYV